MFNGKLLKENEELKQELEDIKEDMHKYMTLANITNQNIFVCDASNENILYWMNDTAKKSLQAMQTNLKNEKNVDTTKILGGSIHRYHKDPARIRQILEELKKGVQSCHKMDIPLGRYILQTNVHPLRSQGGEVIGYAACWRDVSTDRELAEKMRQEEKAVARISTAVEELTASVHSNADSSKQANHLATEARRLSEDGGQVAEDLVTSMSEINESSKKISEITTVIDEIAFQTNLLALNAAIEAARAGEFGKGFAVVATEVRSLAQRSASAAKEIKGLIKDSVQKADGGNRMAIKTGDTLRDIVDSIKKVADLISEISAASSEQARGIDEVNSSILQLSGAMGQESASARQSGAGDREMSGMGGQAAEYIEQAGDVIEL